MPFTTSHPAIILPLKRLFPKAFSMSGLIAGAMSPDLLYFLEMTTVNRGVSHSWSGLFLICLPLGLLFCLIFHHFIKLELILNLPEPLMNHFSGLAQSEFGPKTMKSWVVLSISVLIGAISHFFWDSFTHLHGEMVMLFPLLAEDIVLAGKTIPVYHLLQHLSTLTGAIAIVVFFSFKANLPAREELPSKKTTLQKIFFWSVSVSLSLLFSLIVLEFYQTFFPQRVPGHIVVLGLAAWAGFFYLTALYGFYKHFLPRLNKSTVSGYN